MKKKNKKAPNLVALLIAVLSIVGTIIPSQSVLAAAGNIKFAKATLNGATTELKVSSDAEDNVNIPISGTTMTLLFSTDGTTTASSLKNISASSTNKSNGSTNGTLCVLSKVSGSLSDETVAVTDITPAEYRKTCLNVAFNNLKAASEYVLTVKSGIATNNGADWTDSDTIIAFTTAQAASTGNGANSGTNQGTAVTLTSSDPADGKKDVAKNAAINLVFSKNVVNMTVKDNNLKCFSLVTKNGTSVPIKVIMADDQMEPDKKNNVSIVPESELTAGTSYILKISPDLKSKSGDTTGSEIQVKFTVAGSNISTTTIIAGIIIAAVIIICIFFVFKKRKK